MHLKHPISPTLLWSSENIRRNHPVPAGEVKRCISRRCVVLNSRFLLSNHSWNIIGVQQKSAWEGRILIGLNIIWSVIAWVPPFFQWKPLILRSWKCSNLKDLKVKSGLFLPPWFLFPPAGSNALCFSWGLSGCLILISCPTSLPLTLSLPLTRFHTETQGRTCFPDRSPRSHRSFYRLTWHAGKESQLVTKLRPEVGTSELRICGLLSSSLPSSAALSHLYLVVLLSFLVFLGRVKVNRMQLSIRVRGCPSRWPLFHAQKPFVYTFNPHNR